MNPRPDPIALARQKYGKPFATERGNTFKKRPDGVFLLSLWREQMQAERKRQKAAA